jgi:hypothetical protein
MSILRPFRFYLLALLAVIAQACDKKDELPLIDIPEPIVQVLPYTDGQLVKFRDSAGVVSSCVNKREDGIGEVGDKRVRVISCRLDKDGDPKQRMAELVISATGDGMVSITILQEPHPGGNGSTYRDLQLLRVQDDGVFICDTIRVCHESLVINGKTEEGVVELRTGGPKLFYNKQKGILRWELESGQHYTRVD